MRTLRLVLGLLAGIVPTLTLATDAQPITGLEKASGSGASSPAPSETRLPIVQEQQWRPSVKKSGGAWRLPEAGIDTTPSVQWVGNVLHVRESLVAQDPPATEHRLILSTDGTRLNIEHSRRDEHSLLKGSSAPATTDRRSASPVDILTSLRKGDTLEFTTVDGYTGRSRSIRWLVEQNAGGSIVFNQGARTEGPAGISVAPGSALGGDFASLEPPNGWLPLGTTIGQEWPVKYTVQDGDFPSTFDLIASAVRLEPTQTGAGTFQTIRVESRGWATRQLAVVPSTTRVTFTAWIEAKTHRLIAFTSYIGGGARPSRERTELTAVTPTR